MPVIHRPPAGTGLYGPHGFSDKSHIMRQMEKYADVYEPRVQPAPLRPTRTSARVSSLAHDGDDLAGFLSEQAADE